MLLGARRPQDRTTESVSQLGDGDERAVLAIGVVVTRQQHPDNAFDPARTRATLVGTGPIASVQIPRVAGVS